jgi:uncharacterized membrane protein
MLTLLGVAVIVLGFALRFNPLLVVVAAAMTSAWRPACRRSRCWPPSARRSTPTAIVSVAWLVLPMIGVLERAGLQERRGCHPRFRRVSPGRILIVYLACASSPRPWA